MIGTTLGQRYRIEAQLGEGGMGVVYRAHDTLLDRPVAIKTLSPRLLGEDGLKRLLREAQAAAKLSHPNIVATYDVIEEGETRLIVMEYIEGRTLRELIPVPWMEAVGIAEQVCSALEYAHSRGVVHRDIKPENIVIAPDGTTKIMDFGLARSEGRSRMTQTGMIVGTVAYMAPEQALGGRSDWRSDLYSLGAVLYETVTGKPPFEGEDPIAVISMHVNVPPVSPRFHTPEVPAVLDSAILRLLAKDPTERYATVADVAAVLKTARLPTDGVDGASAIATVGTAPSLFDMMTHGRLVDRAEELGALKSALESMLSGRGQVVLVAGEPGIGKTRLAEELLVYARLRGCLALLGHCYEQELNVPYLPFSEALRILIRTIRDDRFGGLIHPHAPELVKLVPELSQRIPHLAPSPPLEPEQERLRLYDAVIAFLVALAHTQPVVLMLDDIHWADAATLALLRPLARSVRSERILILGTYRDVEVDPDHPLSAALTEMNRERLYKRIVVRGLTAEHVAAMIATVLQTRQPVSEEFRDLIFRETEGNPFFVEEVLKHLAEVGALYIEEGQWQRKPLQEIDVPQSTREVIGRRLKRVSELCLRVLGLGAVIGRRFQFDVLQSIGELSEDELLTALEEAIRVQLIREESDAGDVEYEFVHAIVREVLYERLSLRRRMTLHQKVGETLERLFGGRIDAVVEDLAHHFTRAPHGVGLEKAIQYSLEAARKSLGLFAYEDAVRYYQTAADLVSEIGDEARLAKIYLTLGAPHVYLGNTVAAISAYERALKIFERRGTPADVALVHMLIGSALQRNNWEFSAAVPHLERALQGLKADTHPTDVVRTHLDLARCFAFLGRVADSGTHATEALHLADRLGDTSLQAAAQVALGLAAHRSRDKADIATAMSHYQEAARLAEGSGDPEAYYTLARAFNNMMVLRLELGDFPGGLQLSLQALETARRARNVEQISFNLLQASIINYMLGNSKEATRYAEEALQAPGSPRRRRLTEHRLHWLRGEWEAAAEAAQDSLSLARADGDAQGIYIFAGFLAWHCLDLGRLEDARDAARHAAKVLADSADYHLWWQFPRVVEALARGGDDEQAEILCARGAAIAEAGGLPLGSAFAAYGRGLVALGQGDAQAAVRFLDASHPMDALMQFRAYRLRALASALARRRAPGDVERARDTLQEALSLCEQMGESRKAEQVRAELTALSR